MGISQPAKDKVILNPEKGVESDTRLSLRVLLLSLNPEKGVESVGKEVTKRLQCIESRKGS